MEKINITAEKENPLFKRKEICGTIESEITPTHSETLEILSKKYSVPLDNIKLKNIKAKFGSKTFTINANIYSSKEDKRNTELKKKWEIELEKKKEEELTAQKAEAEKPLEKKIEEPVVKEKPAEIKEETKSEEEKTK